MYSSMILRKADVCALTASSVNGRHFNSSENGITISVQFGTSNYCDRRNMATSYRGDMDAATPIVESTTAEIAIWDENGKWFDFGSDTVKGWVDVNEVAEWIYKCSTGEIEI